MAFGIGTGRKVVAAAGTAVTLESSSHAVDSVLITAETNNTGTMAVGGAAVVATVATRQGTPLNAGDSITLRLVDLYEVYIDATVTGDGVTFTYIG